MTDTFHVRIGNTIPDSTALDVLVDGYPVLTDVDFGDVNDYTEHGADEYAVGVRPSGGEDSLVEESVEFEADSYYTLLLVGTPEDISLRLLEDGPRQ